MQTGQGKARGRTTRLYRLTDDGRRLLAGRIEASSPAELVAHWRAFLATAAHGVYVAHYRGATLGLETAAEAAHSVLAA
jgi:predicted ArsR family transcriptional regulator